MDGVTTTTPSAEDLKLLAVLDEYTEMSTSAVMCSCPDIAGGRGKYQFGILFSMLMDLKNHGLVQWIEIHKPMGCWVRTPAGTEALNAGRDEA